MQIIKFVNDLGISEVKATTTGCLGACEYRLQPRALQGPTTPWPCAGRPCVARTHTKCVVTLTCTRLTVRLGAVIGCGNMRMVSVGSESGAAGFVLVL